METPYIPPELISIIIHHLSSTGIRDSWKLRGVSKVFRDTITDDIVMRQTKDVLAEATEVFDHLMPRYLCYRVRKPLDVHEPFLVRLTKLNDYLCDELKISDPTKKADKLFALCQGQAKIVGCGVIRDLLWSDSDDQDWMGRNWNSDNQDWLRSYNAAPISIEEKVAAAMSVCALPLLHTLLPQLTAYKFYPRGGACFREESYLLAAVSMENNEMLQLLLDNDLPAKFTTPSSAGDYIEEAMRLAIKQSSTARTLALFDAFLAVKSGCQKTAYNSTLKHAIMQSSSETNIDIVTGLIDRCPGGQKVHTQVFTKACKYGNVDAVKVFLEHMAVNNATSHLTLPLNRAIQSGHAAVIDAVLEAGADINKTDYGSRIDSRGIAIPELSPMEIAIKTGQGAVNMLLERGATVPSLTIWYRRGRSMYSLLREAKIAQTGRKLRTWEQNKVIIRRENQAAREARRACQANRA
ncbi:hypothetical protein HBH69_060270 [Parastagonospora nodorum]|nr:hypothetical protein HBH69_060270 [Parastagonospora nodorum]KAH6198648.1 hypothetical protein HBI43_234360 [Parastagonospora nodorum]KAH6242612.1 hypothetical protein HBI42_230070 [Parastagonospora nodorum]